MTYHAEIVTQQKWSDKSYKEPYCLSQTSYTFNWRGDRPILSEMSFCYKLLWLPCTVKHFAACFQIHRDIHICSCQPSLRTMKVSCFMVWYGLASLIVKILILYCICGNCQHFIFSEREWEKILPFYYS